MRYIMFVFCFSVFFNTRAQDLVKNKNGKNVLFDSEKPGCEVREKGGSVIGKTPLLYTKNKSVKVLRIILDGDTSKVYSIDMKFIKNVFINNGGQDGVVKDKYLQKDGYFSESDFFIDPRKAENYAGKQNIRILDPVSDIKPGEKLGSRNGTPVVAVSAEQLYDPTFGSKKAIILQLEEVLSNTYLRPKVFNKKQVIVKSANEYVALQMKIKDFHFTTNEQEYGNEGENPVKSSVIRNFGTGDLKIEWIFQTPEGKDVYKTTTRVIKSAYEVDPKYLFDDILKQSVCALLSDKSLFNQIKGANELLSKNLVKIPVVLPLKQHLFVEEGAKAAIKNTTPAVVTIFNTTEDSFGSGFLVSDKGYIITNYHVIENGTKLKVQLNGDSVKIDAHVIDVDEDIDIALIKIEKENTTNFISFAQADNLEIGDAVFAIGTPGSTQLAQTVSRGIVSGFRVFDDKKYIQTDASINPGNSGGPLINEKGDVVGVIVMKMVGRGIEGLSFVIPASIVMKKLNIKYQ